MCVGREIAKTVNNYEVEFSNYIVICSYFPVSNLNLLHLAPFLMIANMNRENASPRHIIKICLFRTFYRHSSRIICTFNFCSNLISMGIWRYQLAALCHFPFGLSRIIGAIKRWLSEIKIKIKDDKKQCSHLRVFNYRTKSSVNTKRTQTDKKRCWKKLIIIKMKFVAHLSRKLKRIQKVATEFNIFYLIWFEIRFRVWVFSLSPSFTRSSQKLFDILFSLSLCSMPQPFFAHLRFYDP